MFPVCSIQLVSSRIPGPGRLPSAGCRSVPIGWLPGGLACHIAYRCLSAACDLVALSWSPPGGLSALAPGRFPSTSLMCAGSSYMISGWLISHSFRPVYLSKFGSFLSWFVLGQLTSAMSLRSASPVCATGSSRMAPDQLLWDVVLQIPFSWRRIGPSL